MNQLALEFLQVTQAAALAAKPWIGRGRKHEADDAATTAMRSVLQRIPMDGVVVIGEGELDEAPMLYIGERVGTGHGPRLDIAVDPLEGTTLVASGQDNSTAVIAAAPHGCLLHAPDMYMEKLAVGPQAKGCIDLERPLADNILSVAAALGKEVADVTIMLQYRDRHQAAIDTVRQLGARVRLFDDGDVTCAISAAVAETGVDLFYGIGGAPEGVISAVALRCLGGDMQGRLLPGHEAEYERCLRMGIADPHKLLTLQDLVGSENCIFAATGITTGLLLAGITRDAAHAQITHSLVTCGGAAGIHYIRSVHESPVRI
ncbi:fructose-1,6-bisphosphatase II [Paenibacillus sp. UNCCL117]|uniref:class II fructose-bisphosphatase n=1 Tax=unclassified Paenibacillus TaxID=185978 RepID=UPI00088C1771|nr:MULTISPECIES: class II fructose-bisphosphatase [unclassified Paenibacillus]SDD12014.1 fructose-1,6-bisphosphatase II [Paenibacillus sp. cl123]SFW33702.1 fructose-1,6-bisphosphatase II [Paenibacillus sp. UNCCL117]